jgi:hypothetical protein
MSKYPAPRKYFPKHLEKYVGDANNIISRSSWELKFMNWCDNSTNVIKWKSEETIVPYRCGTDNKLHRYYLDFQIEIVNKAGLIKTYLIEIKPQAQTIPPIYKGKQTRRYLNESMTFIKNQSKWEAATRFAKDRGWEFMILTEHHLGIK